MAGSEDRTEKATPRRRKEARQKGEVGNTPEFGAWVAMLAASWVLPWVGRRTMQRSAELLGRVRDISAGPDPARAIALLRGVGWSVASTALPVGALVLFIAVAAVLAQGGFAFAPKVWAPKFSRLNPLSGVKRMFGPHGVWAATQALLKSVALGLVVWMAVRHLVPSLAASGSMPLATLLEVATSGLLTLVRWAAVAGVLLAAVDYAVVRKRNNKSLKMTKQEIRDEFKNSEGDPAMRGARRSRAVALTRNRMFRDTQDADVLIVNPTHVAVALRYDPARGAPRVVARGSDHVAARLRSIAEQHRVPIVADIPLARALHRSCRVGEEIPGDLFHAVAVVLAFLMKLRRRGSTAGTHRVPSAVAVGPPAV